MKATLGYGASTCSYVDWLDADLIVLFGSNVAEQPAGDDEVPAPREEERRADRGRQSVPRAGTRALLGAVDREERGVRHRARRPLVRRAHRRRPARFSSACCARSSRTAASTRRSCASAPTGFEAARDAALAADWAALEARERRDRATRMRAFARLLVERPNAVFVWSMGLTQHAHGVDTIKALINVGLARGLPGRPRPRPGADPRALGRAGRRRSRLRAGGRRGDRGAVDRRVGLRGPAAARLDGGRDGRTRRRAATSTCSGSSAATSSKRCRTPSGRGARCGVRVCASIRTSCCPRRCWSTATATCCSCRRRRATSRRAAAPRRRPSGAIIFSPEIPGRRIGSARPEWQVFGEAMARAFPDRAPPHPVRERRGDPRGDRARRSRSTAGIETLARQGRSVPVGRPHAFCRRPVRDAGRQGALLTSGLTGSSDGNIAGRAVPGRMPVASSASRRGAASSSTRWCSARSIR